MNCYAAFAKDADIRNYGSSGGLFPLISLHFIQNGGVVYAAEYDTSFCVVFNRYTSSEEVKRSFGSKYVQSSLGVTFLRIKKDLKAEQPVLFCGTPCQTAALRNYLQTTKTPMHDLLVMNFICHGVPSEWVFRQYMSRFSSPACTELNMRNKDLGWDYGSYAWKISFSDSTTTTTAQANIPYMRGFLSNLYLRPSCYTCNKDYHKSADITVGDFFGINTMYPDIPSRNGVSSVIVHSPKGINTIKELESQLDMTPVQYADILSINPCLDNPTWKPYFRLKFFKQFRRGRDLDKIIRRMDSLTLKNRVINKLYSKFPAKLTSAKDLPSANQHTLFDNKESCCGCNACYIICPTKAITLKTDDEGFIYPIINNDTCTDCRLCRSVCPYIRDSES